MARKLYDRHFIRRDKKESSEAAKSQAHRAFENTEDFTSCMNGWLYLLDDRINLFAIKIWRVQVFEAP